MPANDIIDAARQRGIEQQTSYAGAVTPAEADALIRSNADVMLVDVRTQAERDWVGRVRIPDAQHVAIEWNTYPGGQRNQEFLAQLQAAASADKTLLFLCRSGVRSRQAAAAATEHGYANCFDILEGFEGDKDAQGHRKTTGGWCVAGLPWLGA